MKWIGKKNSTTKNADKKSKQKSANHSIDFSKFNTAEKDILDSALKLGSAGFFYLIPGSEQLWISKSVIEILGLPDSETIEKKELEALLNAEDKEKFKELFNYPFPTSYRSGNFNFRIRSTGETKEQKTIHIKIAEKSAKSTSLVFGWLQDITAVEKNKKDLSREKVKAEESDQLKTMFLANISHEIRTPMNSILGFSELLDSNSFTQEKREDFISTIKKEAKNLLKLIDDVAEYTKLEFGQMDINKSPCNLNLILNELLLNLNQQKARAGKDEIQTNLTLPDQKGITTYTDSGRLQQILTNLLANALDKAKQSIGMGYSLEEDGKIQFFVKYSGRGLSKEEESAIFNRFLKIEDTLLKKQDNHGLGLILSKSIVKLLGGKIWIQNDTPDETTFYFTIPFESVPEIDIHSEIEKETLAQHYNWRDKVVLIVEDEEVNARFLEALLEETQAQVIIAYTGIQAIELMKSISKIDLVLMDIKMPEMSGYEATRKIREFNKNIPILAQTAFALGNEREKCIQAGCNDLVVKPIEIQDLLNKMEHLFNEAT